jgi:hypothetical protein
MSWKRVVGGCLVLLVVVACVAIVATGWYLYQSAQTPEAIVLATSTPIPSPSSSPSLTPTASSTPARTYSAGTGEVTPTAGLPTEAAGPTGTATLKPTKTPKPTPTPWQMKLRDDLPPLSYRDWPRPAGDNGWGMHFVSDQYYTEHDLQVHVARMKELHIRWALVVYGDELKMRLAAPYFKEAGIVVVWRRMLRAYDPYYDWGRDIKILQEMGMPPYMQAYNEPTLQVEWQDGPSMKEGTFLDLLMTASRDIYNAGGFVGWQFVEDKWLTDAIHALKAHGGERIYRRMFFVPHCYGLNHPPDYTEDVNAVLCFRHYADIFQREAGYIPPMIVGEGGWKYGDDDDNRFPRVDDSLHRDYYVKLYNWFRTGVLSNGEPLPDYLFAFCPWLIASPGDPNAFYDSFAGDRTLTIEALKAIPPFERKFSWDR